MIRRISLTIAGLTCSLVLLLVCFWPVLFEDGQFVHFDSAFFYYPLYLRVQQEWSAGRWPLWDPGQNGGTPILGNPVAAVLYPGKLIYALFPYAWAARLYVIVHSLIALVGMVALCRSCGVSGTGSMLGGLGYAFGAPVLLQCGNVIFLVGAAWVPWGLRAIDRLLRQRRRCAVVELAMVLALQGLGGDPEAAYLTAVSGAGYAALLTLGAQPWPRWLPTWPMILAVLVAWVSGTLLVASTRPALPAWVPPAHALVLAAWVALGAGIVRRRFRDQQRARLAPMLAGLAGACALAVALTAVQLLPVLEFAWRSVRVGEGVALDVYRFSLEPHRFIELIWPNVFGTPGPKNRSWLQAIIPSGDREPWVTSLYMGGLILVLAPSGARLRGVPPWRAWLTAVAAVALAASLGKFASPLWWARWLSIAALGAHDSVSHEPGTQEFLGDGTGSPYAILATLLPGFGVFRFPIKLLPFAAASIAALAGAGWDELLAGQTRRSWRLGWAGLGASLLGLALALIVRRWAIACLTERVAPHSMFGPGDIAGSWAATQRALAQGAVVFAAALALVRGAPSHPWLASIFALVFLTADLTLANGGLIWTAPQACFETPPEAAVRIAAAERALPSPGPFRIHRMANWLPPAFVQTRSPGRLREWVAWDRATLHPLHALPLGLEYGATQGILELDDSVLFFESELMPIPTEMARVLGIPPGQPVCYFPRRAFDLWGVRYFILPTLSDAWESEARGMASFLAETELVYPDPLTLSGQVDHAGKIPWSLGEDWQLRRNRAAYPRAWLVHYARVRPPAAGLTERRELMRLLLFMDDPIWSDPGRPVFDLRAGAIVETDEPVRLRGYLARRQVEPSESVTIVANEPQRVELHAVLKQPGLVILADTDYPGWRLTIDGTRAPIFRTNRLMRGAAVAAGNHTLVYTFQPRSFQVGALISGVAVVVLAAFAWSSRRGAGPSSGLSGGDERLRGR